MKMIVVIGIGLVILLTPILFLFSSSSSPINSNIGLREKSLYSQYRSAYVLSNGAVISNPLPVSWCPNSGIGCDKDTTSEAVSRLARYATMSGYKNDTDLEVKFYYDFMKNNNTNYMNWKLSPSLVPESQDSAVDSELIMIEAMFNADKLWSKDSEGRPYMTTALILMDSLKSGVIDGKYLPYCMYPVGNISMPCERKVYLGYLNLLTLKKMCSIDSFWCGVYDESRTLMIGAIQNGGIYTAYNIDSKTYSYENAPVHMDWVMKQIMSDDSINQNTNIQVYYNKSRVLFMNNTEICQEFAPFQGCKVTTPDTYVYADYLEMASFINDKVFGTGLQDFIFNDRLVYDKPQDQYGNIAILESLAYARKEWKTIE